MKHLLNIPTKWGLGLLAIMQVLPEAAAAETLGTPFLERDVLPILQKN